MKKISEAKKLAEARKILFLTLILISIQAIIFFLPLEIKSKFALNTENPTILSFYLNHFTHFSLNHFLQNIFSFLFIMFLFIILSIKVKDNTKISKILFSATIILPILISASILLISSITNSKSNFLGFSSLLASFYSIFLVLLFNSYLKVPTSISTNFILSILSLYLAAYFFYFEKILTPTLKLLLLALIPLATFYFLLSVNQMLKLKILVVKRKVQVLLILSPFIILFFLFVPLFPMRIIQENSRVGIEAHYIGLIFGFFWVHVYNTLEKLKVKFTQYCKAGKHFRKQSQLENQV